MSKHYLQAVGSDGQCYRIVEASVGADTATLAAPSNAVGTRHFTLEDGRPLTRHSDGSFSLVDGALVLHPEQP